MSRDYRKFKAHQEKGSLWHQFQDSKILKPILKKWLHVRPRKTKKCECGRVEYKQVSSLALKQVNIIQDLSEAIAYLERDREEIKDNAVQELDKLKTSNLESLEKVRILEDVNEELREEIEQLTKRLEVMKHVN
jgi:SpoVK/Ycf46/Vps4 family AAA+-type ATPase